jgi:hypothetical protein
VGNPELQMEGMEGKICLIPRHFPLSKTRIPLLFIGR